MLKNNEDEVIQKSSSLNSTTTTTTLKETPEYEQFVTNNNETEANLRSAILDVNEIEQIIESNLAHTDCAQDFSILNDESEDNYLKNRTISLIEEPGSFVNVVIGENFESNNFNSTLVNPIRVSSLQISEIPKPKQLSLDWHIRNKIDSNMNFPRPNGNDSDLNDLDNDLRTLESKLISKFDKILAKKSVPRILLSSSSNSSTSSSSLSSLSDDISFRSTNSSTKKETRKHGTNKKSNHPSKLSCSSSLIKEMNSSKVVSESSSSSSANSDLNFHDSKNSQRMLDSLNKLRSSKTMCDVILKVTTDGTVQEFPCHKCVLASLSNYFRAMFNSELVESKASEIHLKEVDAATMKSIVEFVYTSKLKLSPSNVQALLSAANLYDFKAIKSACANYMKWKMEPSNSIGIHLFADMYDCKKLKKSSFRYILENFTKVTKHEEFLNLSSNLLVDIIKSDDLNVSCEDLVYESCIKWLKYSYQTRIVDFHQVLGNVRLPLVNSYFLYDEVKNEQCLKNCEKCCKLIEEAIDFDLIKDRRCGIQSKRTRPRNLFELLEALVIHDGRGVDVYFPSIDYWLTLKNCPYPYRKNGITSSGVELYFCGGEFPPTNSFFRYNAVYNEWREMPCLNSSRTELILVNLDSYIYAIGGRDKHGSQLTSVERYDTHLNEWKSCAPLKKTVLDPASCALNGKIYIIEQTGIQIYDPRQDEWREHDIQMPTPRSGCAACAFHGKIFVIGGWNGSNTNCVECYDPTADAWHVCPSMIEPRYKPIVATLNNSIYVCTGKGCKSFRNSIEAFDAEKNVWKFATTLKSGSYWLTSTNLMLLNPLIYNIYDEKDHSIANDNDAASF